MKTFLAWATANLEIIGAIILLPFIWIFLSRHPELCLSDRSMWVRILFLSFLIAFGGGSAWGKGTLGDIFSLLLTALGVFYLIIEAIGPDGTVFVHLGIAGGIGIVLGTAITIFAVSNFYEIVSLRWLYLNSNASKFQESALYGFSRFAIGFHIGAFAYALML